MRKRTIGRSRARSKRRKGGKKRRSQGGGLGYAELRALIGAYIAEGPEATLNVEGDDIQAAFRIFKEEHREKVRLLKVLRRRDEYEAEGDKEAAAALEQELRQGERQSALAPI